VHSHRIAARNLSICMWECQRLELKWH